MVQWPVRHLGTFYVCQCAWRIVPIIFNNVSLCPSIFQFDALTTTLPAPLVMMFQVYEQ